MKANDIIESYVTEVASRLPRRQRNDVAFELRALLHEELEARAEGAGRAADEVMATELVHAFGRPADVAARYRPALTIIDPEDGHAFLRATVAGLALIWVLGLAVRLRQPLASGWDLLTVLGGWWGGTVIPSLWWPGVVVVWYGLSAWSRRRWPRSAEWSSRSGERGERSRPAILLGLFGILAGLFVLTDPRGLMDAMFGSHIAPAAYEALTYTAAFKQRQAPVLLVVLSLNIPLLLTVIVNGHWTATARRFERGLTLVTCAVLIWIGLGGPVFMSAASDRAFKGASLLIAAITLVGFGLALSRGVRPAPDPEVEA